MYIESIVKDRTLDRKPKPGHEISSFNEVLNVILIPNKGFSTEELKLKLTTIRPPMLKSFCSLRRNPRISWENGKKKKKAQLG